MILTRGNLAGDTTPHLFISPPFYNISCSSLRDYGESLYSAGGEGSITTYHDVCGSLHSPLSHCPGNNSVLPCHHFPIVVMVITSISQI